MSTQVLATIPTTTKSEALERAMISGDLTSLKVEERIQYYLAVCESMGLNRLTRPFEYMVLKNKMTLYATKNCTDQLRHLHDISVSLKDMKRLGELISVTANATTPKGRFDESSGVVFIGNARGEDLANAMMKAETKAKRRVTLSICGLSMVDESEIDSIKGAIKVSEDYTPPQAIKPQEEQKPKELTPEKPHRFKKNSQESLDILHDILRKKNFDERIWAAVEENMDDKEITKLNLQFALHEPLEELRIMKENEEIARLRKLEANLAEHQAKAAETQEDDIPF